MKILKLSVLALLLGGALTGCSTVNTVERADPVGTVSYVDDKRIITDSGLNRIVNIVSVNEATVQGGLLKIQVQLRNDTSGVKAFNYRFEWYDMDGMLVNAPTSSWQIRMIEGGETISLVGVAPNSNAKDFRLKLLEDVRHPANSGSGPKPSRR